MSLAVAIVELIAACMMSDNSLLCVAVLCFVSCPAAFCLPLDIISQVAINMIFFCIHFPATVCQVRCLSGCQGVCADARLPGHAGMHAHVSNPVACNYPADIPGPADTQCDLWMWLVCCSCE